ncbi:radical SAM protein [Solidesulfovibrio carbinoliphilus]|uniref:radical SAM protein n=1 Tax=Solidesulfovibrio carbinoliphilus TaxID=345370 RepID=UPI001E57228C|nr:radical SAM protein [Solidesulfovibrio carbinoliphilus]
MSCSPAWELVRGIEPLSLCDWPGRICAVLFFGGCDLRCPHCHNAALAWRPEGQPALAAASVRRFAASHAKWLDGIVLTGGEPTLAPGLADFAAELAAFGPRVRIDSNGMRPDVLAAVLVRHPDAHFAVDVKAPFAKYGPATGGAVTPEAARERLLAVFALAARHPGRFAFRTTLVPELAEADVREIREALPPGCSHTVQPCNTVTRIGEERRHAQADSKTRRVSGNVVHPAHRPGDPQSPQGQRHPGPAPGHATGPQGRMQA